MQGSIVLAGDKHNFGSKNAAVSNKGASRFKNDARNVFAKVVVQVAVNFRCVVLKLVCRLNVVCRESTAHVYHAKLNVFLVFKGFKEVLGLCNGIVP